MSVPVPYKVVQAPPTVLEVQAADGKTYLLELRLAVSGVQDLQTVNIAFPGMPLLSFQANLLTTTRRR